MPFRLVLKPYTLNFSFKARTSRGAMDTHKVYYLILSETGNQEITGIGECAPLPGLSPDFPHIQNLVEIFVAAFNKKAFGNLQEVEQYFSEVDAASKPALKFGLETALLDFKLGGKRLLFTSDFITSGKGIPINGLVWMANKHQMMEQVRQKIALGFTTIKLKIGALNFTEELEILGWIRQEFAAQDLTLRVDANGAFSVEEALDKLNALSDFQLHSIEQPIKPGLPEELACLCERTPVPIALDEELISVGSGEEKRTLLEVVKPQYLVLKPTLHGGLQSCAEWIELAEERNIPWWLTSALESNIGLNAISQFAASYYSELPQGLGTGQLYHNNIPSPLQVTSGHLFYNSIASWDLELLTGSL